MINAEEVLKFAGGGGIGGERTHEYSRIRRMSTNLGKSFWTDRIRRIRPRTNPDSCSFALFVLIRGLKQVKNILTFPSYESHKSERERAGAISIPFLCVDFLIVSARTIRMSADRIRKLADTIRRLTGGSKA